MAVFAVRAVVFDVDGVLVDSEAINVRSAFEAFGAFGHVLRPDDAAEIVGRHPVDYVPVLALRLGAREEEQRRIRELQGSIYIALWREQARLKEGAAEILGWLRERGYRLGLATSGGRGHVAHCLERFALGGLFEVVLTKDDVASRKPDPEIYVRCAGHFRVDPGGMLVVEDSEHGVRAARSAGARCVALLTPHVPAERVAQADAVIASLLELRGLLE